MPARVVGSFERLIAEIAQEGGRITKSVNDQIEVEAKQIQRIARLMVPYEKGNMERAIKVDNANRRRRWIVYVDDEMPDDTGKYTVGSYLTFLHESQYKLGTESIAKQSGNPYTVGNKFLERAFETQKQGMLARISAAVRRAGI